MSASWRAAVLGAFTFGLSMAPALIVVAGAAAPGVAHADDDPRKKAAEATFQEGVRLHSQGRSEEGLAKLKKAYETYPSPNTLGGIARVEQALGRNLEALRHYREALRNPLMHPENAEHARGAIRDLEKELARVDVKGPKGLAVKIDEREYILPLAEPVDMKPETLTLVATLAGTRYEGRATAVMGRLTEIEMSPSTAASSPPAQGVDRGTVTPPRLEERSFWDAGRVTGVALFGAGLVGLGAGVLFGASSNDSADRGSALQGKLGTNACAGAAPPQECADLRDARDDQDRSSTLSTVFLVGGAAFAAAGVGFFLWPRSDVRLTPSATGNGASLFMTGRF